MATLLLHMCQDGRRPIRYHHQQLKFASMLAPITLFLFSITFINQINIEESLCQLPGTIYYKCQCFGLWGTRKLLPPKTERSYS